MKQQHSIDKQHAEELLRVRKDASKGPEAAIERLELQNARLRRLIIMAQSSGGSGGSGGGGGGGGGLSFGERSTSFTSTPSVPPPVGPPPVRTGRRRSNVYNFSVQKRVVEVEVDDPSLGYR